MYTIQVSDDPNVREEIERSLEQGGVQLPLQQLAAWPSIARVTSGRLVVVRHGQHALAAGVLVDRTRALPGHTLYRVSRLTPVHDSEVFETLVRALTDAARADRRCLRLSVELFDTDASKREHAASLLRSLGYEKSTEPRIYERTLVMALRGSEADLLSAVHKTGRQNIRAPAKRGLVTRAILESAYAPVLERLVAETFARTSGQPPRYDWTGIVEWSARQPARSRLVGIFDPRVDGPESLVGFAWGCITNRYATYEVGASTRSMALGSVSLAYAPLWELILWARQSGATVFDFGGVTAGSKNSSDDALGGISDFKRYFTQNVVSAGEEWFIQPRPFRASLARLLAAGARRINALRRGR